MTIIEKDLEYVWHPFTQMKNADTPIVVSRANGASLFTDDGREIIDAVSSWWVNIHGHAHPYIADKIAKQTRELEQVIFAGFTHAPAVQLAERLVQILPGNFSKVFYSDNGSTAVEVALKMAVQYWHNKGFKNRNTFVAFEGAYHGDTFGAMSAAERNTFTEPFNSMLFQVEHLPLPHAENIEALEAQMEQLAQMPNVAGFIFEPLVQGAAGMRMYAADMLDRLLAIAKKHRILCIADEVMTGFGRTGTSFAIKQLQQKPDIICLSKGITGGFLPLSATVTTAAVFEAFWSDNPANTFFHGHSYTANPIACAAALASIELLRSVQCKNQRTFIAQSHAVFADNIRKHPSVKEARHTGTILAVELRTTENTSYFHSLRNVLYHFCLEKNVLLRPLGNVLYCMPPYCISEQELQLVYHTLVKALDHVAELQKQP